MSEFKNTNFAKLNVVQQQIAELFQKHELTRPEVFVILRSMRDFKMVNRELAEIYWDGIKWADKHNSFGSHPFREDLK